MRRHYDLTLLAEHITAMPVNNNAPVGHYHGPPSRDQAIVSRQTLESQ